MGPTAQIFSAPQDKRTEDYISVAVSVGGLCAGGSFGGGPGHRRGTNRLRRHVHASISGEIAQYIAAHPSDAETALDLFMISKYLERLGDHAVNVAEWVELTKTACTNRARSCKRAAHNLPFPYFPICNDSGSRYAGPALVVWGACPPTWTHF